MQRGKDSNSTTQSNYSDLGLKAAAVGAVIGVGYSLWHCWQRYLDHKLYKYVEQMPKIELHAHLHGSIKMSLLAQLYEDLASNSKFANIVRPNEDPQQQIRHILKKQKTFNDCFKLFDIIHRVVQSKDILERITEEVLLDFARENVKYLELRSTPRVLQHSGHSRQDYVEIILNKIIEFPKKYPQYSSMTIRFIITINNAKPIAEAWESLEIAKYFINRKETENLIVGVDFAPRPIDGKQFGYYKSLLTKAREMNLKITVHFAEFFDRREQDFVLNFRPDRLGHAIHLKKKDWQILLNEPIPIEMCPTSNIFTKSIEGYKQHPFKRFMSSFKKDDEESLYPMLVCTDDYGVFETCLTNEWYQMAKAHNLTKNTIKQLTFNSINFTFCRDQVKHQLKQDFKRYFVSLDASA